jgi:glycosyltransferase involved in cell wall biosynthesis
MHPFVVVPTYNERDNLPAMAAALLRIPGVSVLVVDDQSPDGTGAEADRLARESGGRLAVVHRTGRRGLGLSYIDGMRRALQAGATHVCQMDADFSHDPGPALRAPARSPCTGSASAGSSPAHLRLGGTAPPDSDHRTSNATSCRECAPALCRSRSRTASLDVTLVTAAGCSGLAGLSLFSGGPERKKVGTPVGGAPTLDRLNCLGI